MVLDPLLILITLLKVKAEEFNAFIGDDLGFDLLKIWEG
jgi:hypothetical protein